MTVLSLKHAELPKFKVSLFPPNGKRSINCSSVYSQTSVCCGPEMSSCGDEEVAALGMAMD